MTAPDPAELLIHIPPQPAGLARLGLYARTLRHFDLIQLGWLAVRRLLPARRPVILRGASRRPGVAVPAFLAPPVPDIGPEQIAFLNSGRPLDPEDVDWVAADRPKLWRYNLHYFDYLHWPVYADVVKAQLIDSWIERNPPAGGDGWEPYPVSLRVVNWIRWDRAHGALLQDHRAHGAVLQDHRGHGALLQTRDDGTSQGDGPVGARHARDSRPYFLDSLATQCAWLERTLEHHLRANHLLKNAKALFFAGVFLDGADADRWRALGLKLLKREAAVQILPDGGHFERSPMYHCIVLEDLLDAVLLAEHNPALIPPPAMGPVRAAAERALAFLEGIRGGHGEIPLFNDSAFGITRPAGDVVEYGRRVLGSRAGPAPTGGKDPDAGVGARHARDRRRESRAGPAPTVIEFPDSGYFGVREGGTSLIIDCGDVGPDCQPGHAHADTLSYEFCLDGEPVVVDSGVYDYEPGPLRRYLRGTSAHNTVRIDGLDQSEVWGGFRVGRRARPIHARLTRRPDGCVEFTGSHGGYRHLPGGVVHRRQVVIRTDGWQVVDVIEGAPQPAHRIESFINLHSNLQVKASGPREFRVSGSSGDLCRLIVTCSADVRVDRGYHCPEFGVCLRTSRVVLSLEQQQLPARLSYEIRRA